MSKRIGKRLGAVIVAAALAGMFGAAAAQDSSGGARHFERFTQHELRMCRGASGLMQNLNTGDVKARYLENYYAFGPGIAFDEPIEVFTDRVYLMFHQLSREELKALADACEQTLEQDDAAPRFALIRTETLGETAFARFTETRAAERAAAERGRLAYEAEARERERAEAAQLSQACNAVIEEGTAKATRSFKQAQSEIQVWIRAGAFGSAPGSYDIQNGCNAIDSAGGQLNRLQCPAEYAQALMNFRAQYFINFNGGSGYGCN